MVGRTGSDPADSLPERIHVRRVGEAEEVLSLAADDAKAAAVHQGDPVVVEEEPGHQGCGTGPRLPGIRQRIEVRRGAQGFTDARDVRKHVEGAERIRAADPVDGVERRHHVVAAPLELRHHRTHHLKGLGVLERLAGRLLNEGRNAAHRVDVDLLEPDGLLHGGQHAPPEPPAGHRVALRVSARDDRVPLHSRKGSHRCMFEAIEGDVLVDLIRIDADVRTAALAHQCGNLLEQALRKYPARGIRGGAQHQDLRLFREQPVEILHREGEAALFAENERFRHAPEIGHPRFVNREPRARIDDLVAGVHVGHHRVADGRLRPREDDDPIRGHLDAARPGHVAGQGFPERSDPGGVRVVGVPGADGGDPGFVDVRGAVEVGFADGEGNDIHAAGAGAGHVFPDLERVFGTHVAETPGKKRHVFFRQAPGRSPFLGRTARRGADDILARRVLGCPR